LQDVAFCSYPVEVDQKRFETGISHTAKLTGNYNGSTAYKKDPANHALCARPFADVALIPLIAHCLGADVSTALMLSRASDVAMQHAYVVGHPNKTAFTYVTPLLLAAAGPGLNRLCRPCDPFFFKPVQTPFNPS
jgi:hypothetical protein